MIILAIEEKDFESKRVKREQKAEGVDGLVEEEKRKQEKLRSFGEWGRWRVRIAQQSRSAAGRKSRETQSNVGDGAVSLMEMAFGGRESGHFWAFARIYRELTGCR
jgi:hypothetical protein